jgi:hypothetical protein
VMRGEGSRSTCVITQNSAIGEEIAEKCSAKLFLYIPRRDVCETNGYEARMILYSVSIDSSALLDALDGLAIENFVPYFLQEMWGDLPQVWERTTKSSIDGESDAERMKRNLEGKEDENNASSSSARIFKVLDSSSDSDPCMLLSSFVTTSLSYASKKKKNISALDIARLEYESTVEITDDFSLEEDETFCIVYDLLKERFGMISLMISRK